MLDYAGYVCGNILEKHIIDNSCGAGAFLCEAVARYCSEYVANHDDNVGLKADLERFVHGIELDPVVCADCRSNLDGIAKDFGVENVGWDLLNTNALSVTRYDGQMDFVVGNPPYVRVHNLEEDYDEVKSFRFAEGGMTDLYLAFYELGLRMINGTGKLCYITPSSWLSSVAATNMRKYVMQHRTLAGLIDLGHQQVFENVTAYTMIALFDARHQADGVEYYTYSAADSDKVYVDTITYGEMSIGDSFYVASKEDLSLLRVVKTASVPRYVRVKNGFATLADKVFILNVSFDALTIPVLKASTGKWYKAFFPYDAAGKPLSREAVFSHPDVADYLNRNKKELLKKHTERENPDWYLYGRTQAIRDVFERKYSINFIIQDQLPYYRRDTHKTIQRWETFTKRNASKYICLSRDDANVFYHTPNKTLIYVVHLPENRALRTKDEYMGYYRNQDCSVMLSEVEFGPMEPGVILNDYETFIEKVYHTILAQ